MFGQLIHRLTTLPSSPVVGEETPLSQGEPVEQDPIRQWRVVSHDGSSSLFDLDIFKGDQDLPHHDSGEPDPPEPAGNRAAENKEKLVAASVGSLVGKRTGTTTKNIGAPFSADIPVIGSRRRSPTSPNIGMPAALPRTSEILRAAEASRSIETQEPSRHRAPPLDRQAVPSNRTDACVEKAARADSSPPVLGDGGAISRSLVADAAAASPVRFRRASPLTLLRTPAAGREIDANLAKIITLWPGLTWPVKAAVLAMVDAASRES